MAILELLYGRAALGMPVAPDMPASEEVPEHAPTPDGASARWQEAFDAVINDFAADKPMLPRWLSSPDATSLDVERARQWLHEQRERVIGSALTPTGSDGPRLTDRGQSLSGGPITHVLVLPLAGPYAARPRDGVLITDMGTFLDDRAWAAAMGR